MLQKSDPVTGGDHQARRRNYKYIGFVQFRFYTLLMLGSKLWSIWVGSGGIVRDPTAHQEVCMCPCFGC
nr:hypothetical protein CFP56_39241 [Quercus suber]